MDEAAKILESFQIEPYHLYNALVKSSDNYIYVVDMASDLALVSENMSTDFSLPGRVVPSLITTWGALIHPRDQERYYASIQQMLDGRTDEHNIEYQIQTKNGEYVWVVCRGQLERDDQGQPLMFAGVVTNLTNKGRVDATTGLFTQVECEKQVESILEHAGTGTIMLLGLDEFARINSLNNHVFGDAVLRQFAQNIQLLLPPGASMYRYDGDEFVIVGEQLDQQDMLEIYQKIHAYSNREQQIDGRIYFCSASAGITVIGQDGDDYVTLLKYADCALESSKQRGKNTCTFFTPSLIDEKLRRLKIADELQFSVLNDMERFSLVYQPFAHSDTLEVVGAEALLRWNCQPFGDVSPMEFVPILEASNMIVPVGKWVLEQAVTTCKRWIAACPQFVMNVNISYLQLLDEDFFSFIINLLHDHELPPEHLVLELTESYFVTDINAMQAIFDKLRDYDIRIAMDDFGTGYSSLGRLYQSPADIVKIDRVFINDIHHQENAFNRSFIGAVIQLCHSIGITVCVEGVEQDEDLAAVCSLQADSIQGYYLSKPITAEQFEAKYLSPLLALPAPAGD